VDSPFHIFFAWVKESFPAVQGVLFPTFAAKSVGGCDCVLVQRKWDKRCRSFKLARVKHLAKHVLPPIAAHPARWLIRRRHWGKQLARNGQGET